MFAGIITKTIPVVAQYICDVFYLVLVLMNK